jgi:hypothetical protein
MEHIHHGNSPCLLYAKCSVVVIMCSALGLAHVKVSCSMALPSSSESAYFVAFTTKIHLFAIDLAERCHLLCLVQLLVHCSIVAMLS